MFEKHHRLYFAYKNQLPGFYFSGTLVENGLTVFMHYFDFMNLVAVICNKEALMRYNLH